MFAEGHSSKLVARKERKYPSGERVRMRGHKILATKYSVGRKLK